MVRIVCIDIHFNYFIQEFFNFDYSKGESMNIKIFNLHLSNIEITRNLLI